MLATAVWTGWVGALALGIAPSGRSVPLAEVIGVASPPDPEFSVSDMMRVWDFCFSVRLPEKHTKRLLKVVSVYSESSALDKAKTEVA